MSDGSHAGRRTSWIAAIAMVLGTVLVGFAMIFTSWIVFGVGVVIGVVGLGVALATNMMSDFTT